MRTDRIGPTSALALFFIFAASLFFTAVPEASAAWVRKADLTTARARYAWTLHEGRFYAFFGNDGTKLLNSVDVYDPAADNWTQSVPDPLQAGVQDVSAASWNGRVYFFGGNYALGSNINIQDFFRSYDIAAGTMQNETPRNPAIASANAVAYSETAPASGLGPLKIFGGVLDTGVLYSQATAYDPQQGVWQQVGSIPAAAFSASPGCGAYTPDNLVFFFGGDTGLGASTKICAYNYFTKSYITEGLGSLSVYRRFPAFGSMPFAKGRFYLAGGNQSITGYPSQVLEVYDATLRAAWRIAEDLPEGLSAQGSFILAGPNEAYTLYVAGGLAEDQTRSDRLYALCVDNGRGQLPSQVPPEDTDLNENGVPDIDEPDVIKDVITVAGNNIAGVDISGDANIFSISSIQAIPADFAGDPPRVFSQGALTFALEVTPGATVQVDVYFAQDITAGSIWYKYNADDGWYSYAQWATTVSNRRVTLQLTDGGAGDADGIANGVILDPGGPSTAIPPDPPEPDPEIVIPSGNGCFVESLLR